MDISSLGGVASAYSYANQIRNKSVSSSDFANSLKEAYSIDKSASTKLGFEDMWKTKFPGAKYHVMDASAISQGVWARNDFPFEKFFEEPFEVINQVLINELAKTRDSLEQYVVF